MRQARTLLLVLLAALVAGEWLVHPHAAFGFAGWPGFTAVLAFVACLLLLGIARSLARLLRRLDPYGVRPRRERSDD